MSRYKKPTRGFVEKLRGLRKSKGVSQQVIADFCGVHQTTYSWYERGLTEPSAEVQIRLAEYFGVSTDALMCRKFDNGPKIW